MSNPERMKDLAEKIGAACTQRFESVSRIGKVTQDYLEDCRKANEARAEHIADLLEGFAEEREKQRVADSTARAEGIAAMMSDFAAAHEVRAEHVADLKAAAQDTLRNFATEHAAAARAWQNLIGKMRDARDSAAGPLLPKETEEPSRRKLRSKLLSLIQQSGDDGMKLMSAAKKLKAENWQSLLPIAVELMEKGTIRKDDSRYFAT